MTNKGFGTNHPIKVESAEVELPAVGVTIAYRPNGNGTAKWMDLDQFTELLGVAFSPDIEKVRVYTVKPFNGIFKNQVRRAIAIPDGLKIIRTAVEAGCKEAEKLQNQMIVEGMQQMGIDGAVLEGNVLTPIDKDGKRIEGLALELENCDGVLIEGWLFMENIKSHRALSNESDLTSLPMVVNILIAIIADRKTEFCVPVSRAASVEYMQFLLPKSGLDGIVALHNLEQALAADDEVYEMMYRTMLSETRKQAIIDPYQLPKRIRECTEVKAIIDAKKTKDPAIKLINGWMHPLSEVSNTNGEPFCNTWQFASLVMGSATQRVKDTEDTKAISLLISLKVIESPLSEKLIQAKTDDSIYLELLNAAKDAMDKQIQEQLGNNEK